MKPSSSRLRKLLLGLVVVGGLSLALMTYAYFEFTAQPDLVRIQTPNMLDAQEAERKLRLFTQARSRSRQGFIRIMPVELNSLLHQRMNRQFPTVESPLNSGQSRLTKCLVDFDGNRIRWYCWVEKNWMGVTWSLIWQRHVDLVRQDNQWHFQPVAMRLGRREIPERYWPELRQAFARADEQFVKQIEWLTRMPALEFTMNRSLMGRYPELKLYTYPEPAVLHASR